MRGYLQETDKIQVCVEHWTAPHHNGYVEGWLKESELLLIDLSDGTVLSQYKAGIDAYKDIVPMPLLFRRVLEVYEDGWLPCGWKGNQETGKLIVY